MLTLENILSPQMIQRLGWMLLHFTWQATAVAMVLAVLMRILRGFSAKLRYIVACLGLVSIVLIPAITIGFVRVSKPVATVHTESVIEPVATVYEAAAEAPASAEAELFERTHPESAYRKPSTNYKQKTVSFLEPKLDIIVTLWLLGVFALSIWHLGGWAQLHRLRRRMVRPVDESLQSRLRELSGILGVHRVVELMESALVQAPTAIGWLKPVILLPASALTGLSQEQLEGILAHELAHIKRYDYLVNILQTAVETLGFYHPAVWWISKTIRVERENCCDDIAVKLTGDSISYAKTLASFEEIQAGRPELAVAATGGYLFSRISRLLGKDSTEKSLFSLIPAVTDIMFLAILVILISNVVLAQTPTLFELLDKHKETREKLTTSFIAKTETFAQVDYVPRSGSGAEPWQDNNYSNYEFRYDGNQNNTRINIWGDLNSRITDIPENDPHYVSYYNLTDRYITYNRLDSEDAGRLTLNQRPVSLDSVRGNLANGYRGHEVFGYMQGDAESFDEILRNPAYDVSIRNETEEIGGSQCYIIDADTDRGKYTLWIDPAHGYNLARAEVVREEGDITGVYRDIILKEGERCHNVLENVKFEQIDGVWIAVEADVEVVMDPLEAYTSDIFGSNNTYYTEKIQYKLTDFIRDPDHEALRSFEPDDIPNGVPVMLRQALGMSYTWQDGELVPDVDEAFVSEIDNIAEQLLEEEIEELPIVIDPSTETVQSLLKKYQAGYEKQKSFIAKADTTVGHTDLSDSQVTEQCEFRTDGISKVRLCKTVTDKSLPEDETSYTSFVGNSIFLTQYTGSRVYLSEDQDEKKRLVATEYRGAPLIGICGGNYDRIDTVLLSADNVIFQQKTELVNGYECYVIEAKNDNETYKVWFAPQHGYNIAKIEIQRGGDAHITSFSMKNVRFENIDNIWVPMEADIEQVEDGQMVTWHHQRTEMILNPDHIVLESFRGNDIPDGTELYMYGEPAQDYIWQNGDVRRLSDIQRFQILN